MIRIILTVLFASALTNVISAQKASELGVEYMRSTGSNFKSTHIGPRFEAYSNKHSWTIGFTYNFSARSSYSGYRGLGMYAGYRFGFAFSNSGKGNAFAGARAWFSFDNFDGKTNLNSLFVTPMAEAGYHLIFGGHMSTSPFIGYGFTKKITKEYNSLDEDFGARILPGIDLGYRF